MAETKRQVRQLQKKVVELTQIISKQQSTIDALKYFLELESSDDEHIIQIATHRRNHRQVAFNVGFNFVFGPPLKNEIKIELKTDAQFDPETQLKYSRFFYNELHATELILTKGSTTALATIPLEFYQPFSDSLAFSKNENGGSIITILNDGVEKLFVTPPTQLGSRTAIENSRNAQSLLDNVMKFTQQYKEMAKNNENSLEYNTNSDDSNSDGQEVGTNNNNNTPKHNKTPPQTDKGMSRCLFTVTADRLEKEHGEKYTRIIQLFRTLSTKFIETPPPAIQSDGCVTEIDWKDLMSVTFDEGTQQEEERDEEGEAKTKEEPVATISLIYFAPGYATTEDLRLHEWTWNEEGLNDFIVTAEKYFTL